MSIPSSNSPSAVAVNTGEAVVALGARPELGEGFVTGDVVDVASQLPAEAPVGGIVVGGDHTPRDPRRTRVRAARGRHG